MFQAGGDMHSWGEFVGPSSAGSILDAVSRVVEPIILSSSAAFPCPEALRPPRRPRAVFVVLTCVGHYA